MPLPHCDTLFTRYFAPWYSEQDRLRRLFRATRPDIEELELPAESNAFDPSPLTMESQPVAAERISDMIEAATVDWRDLLDVKGEPSISWISAFDHYFNRLRIQEIIRRSDPAKYNNDYIVLCCELDAVLGAVLNDVEPQLSWLYDWPYWESALYCKQTRLRINVFHWAVKRLGEYGVEDDLTAKIAACRSILHEQQER